MTIHLDNQLIEHSQKAVEPLKLNAKETRLIVTPYAFFVADELLGTPLARPFRRALALCIDLFFILLLTQVNSAVLAALMAWAFFRAGNRLKTKKRFNFVRIILRLLVALLLFVVAKEVVEEVWLHDQTLSSMVSEQPSTPSLPELTDVEEFEGEKAFSLVEWFDNLVTEMGLGFGWATFYFSVFTAWWKGQTPGKKLLGIKVIKLDNQPLNLWESFGRYGGYAAGIATGLSGFLQIYWDPNRQAIQDKISATLVIDLRKPKVEFNQHTTGELDG
ncbi:RDD family protein [Paraglaciecola aestuariivivens]